TLFLIFPFGIYLMWKGQHFNKDLRWMLTLMPIISAVYFGHVIKTKSDDNPKSCSSTIIADGCTYHRDENCKVVASSCDEE
ncbi:MAG: hypothetical protein AB8B80_09335, partial [Marinicellaceae bacterium]